MRMPAYGEPVDGTPFGRYRLIELLGRGGMGEVWRAHDTDTDRIVAIKLLPAHFSENEDFQRRFRREAHAAARLNTPHVIPIHNYGEIDGRLYVDMRLIEGSDLQAVLAKGPMEPARAVRIIEGVALALHAAHKVGLLHRDVKPSNILLDENDFAYLIDFGIARAADETRLTKSGNAIGTFQYIAPERLESRAGEDARADIYSLACVLYECLTGQPPFDEDSMARLVAAHLNTPPPKPSTTQPNVPAQIDPVIATGMAKDPDNRYATTVDLADAARDAITTPLARQGPIVPVHPPARPEHLTAHPFHVQNTQRAAATPGPLPGPPPRVPQGLGNVHPAVERPPAQSPRPRRWWRRKRVVIPAAVTLAVAVAAAVIAAIVVPHRGPRYGPPTVLPFTSLQGPVGVAVNAAGDVYVTDARNNRVLKLAAGSSTQTELPFTGLKDPGGVAVDAAGSVYITDSSERVLKLAAGSSSQTVLPFTGLLDATGVAVDAAGGVYVADVYNNRVLKLAVGSGAQTELPLTGLFEPTGVAADAAGSLFVADTKNRVVKVAAGSSTQVVLPFTGLNDPWGVAVDTAGGVYVTDRGNNRVVKLPAGSSNQVVLPLTGLNNPDGVAVDAAGGVYVTDVDNNRVLKLPAQ
jgi:serine/threonine protein kinase, bacterial